VLIAIDKDLGAEVILALSVTVTLKLKGLPAAEVGVPAMIPLVPFSDNPGGSEPDDTCHPLYGGVPEEALSI
jgi:hypothetical protein